MKTDNQVKFIDYGLDHIEWGCRKHNMNKIWIDESHAICLQCAVESGALSFDGEIWVLKSLVIG